MFEFLISLDYELPAGGTGDVLQYIIEPTASLLQLCKSYGAKVTIMVEMGELWAFENTENAGFSRHLGYDSVNEIRSQLVGAIQQGHDVQLHLHPQWINARWNNAHWDLDYAHYKLSDFSDEEMVNLLRRGKQDLEIMLSPHCPDYQCVGFRAGHWNTEPSNRYLAALRAAGLKSDTSVFKWGYANNSAVSYDYRTAESNVLAWYAREDDINRRSSGGGILEVPIATELTRFIRMLTPKRLWLARRYLRENGQISAAVSEAKSGYVDSQGRIQKIQRLFGWHPRKLDFCKLTGKQMLAMIKKIVNQFENEDSVIPIPLMMIGHSKQVGVENGLRLVLGKLCEEFNGRIRFSTYRAFLDAYAAALRQMGKAPDEFTAEQRCND
jgi:hypothetical protein